MIIGISGKKGHGKDTLALIIQYLTSPLVQSKTDFSEFREYFGKRRGFESSWQKKMFAEKLKQIVCLLIGCTMEQLEDQDFKEKELGEEWRVWYLWDSYNEKRSSTIFMSREEAYKHVYTGNSVHSLSLTPRLLLQLIGTECGRQIIHPNIWVNALMSEYRPNFNELSTTNRVLDWAKEAGKQTWSDIDLINVVPESYPNWIITDLRFPNEAKAIKDRGGLLIRIDRPSIKSTDNHPSETSLDDYDGFDIKIGNSDVGDGIQRLIYLMDIILKSHKLI